MSDTQVDAGKRRFLLVASGAAGGIAVAGIAVPFVGSMLPSAKAKAAGAPVEVDVSKLEPGAQLTVEWRGKPVWVVRRTPEMVAQLEKNAEKLSDPASETPQQPEYCKNKTRSLKAEYLVVVGVCTHLGCSPTFRADAGAADLGGDWPGGYYCPCHGSRFDLAGRVFKNVPAPVNLAVPPHHYLSDTVLLVGADAKEA